MPPLAPSAGKTEEKPYRETWNMPYTEASVIVEEAPARQAVNQRLKKNLRLNNDEAKLKQLELEMKLDKHK